MPRTLSVAAVALIAAAGLAGEARAQYQLYPPQPYPYPYPFPAYSYAQPQPTPPSWNYDPYTSGLTPCPQWYHGDQTGCGNELQPSFGQPNYRPTR